ncbi:MAG TPA: hypothetical protein VLK34_01750 [Nocardioidaceae bacterium]|nr:hypothetical protein [Nocardioidaceae bacterium]
MARASVDWHEQWDDEPPPLTYAYDNHPIPGDARRMGLDRNTEEGAIVAMVGSLNPAKPMHRFVAWVLLAVFCVPLLITLLNEFS